MKKNDMTKKYPTIGCCGIDCGLCPRFYTKGASRCPGCGGEDFDTVHPLCGVKTCCFNRKGLEACGQCKEYPCVKYEDKEKIERDSFITHKRIFINQEQIQSGGIESFVLKQKERISILQDMLTEFDDGRSKGFYCLSAALLPPDTVKALMAKTSGISDRKEKAKEFKESLATYAGNESIKLLLKKNKGTAKKR